MKTTYKSNKLEHCKDELRALLEKLMDGYYKETAKDVFDMVAHTGVETDKDLELKKKPTLEEFLDAK